MILFSSAGFSFNPGIITSFPANTIPYVNASQELSYDSLFTYQGGNLGIGVSTSLQGRLHVRGTSNSSTSKAAYFQSLDNEILSLYNNRQIVAGGGAAFTNTDFTFNAFTTGGDVDTRLVAYFKDSSADNVVRIHNTPGYSKGGVSIYRNSTSYAREALSIYGVTTKYFGVMSNGTLVWPNEVAWPDDAVTFISNSSTAGLKGLLFNVVGSSTSGFVFHKGRTTNSVPGTELFMQLYGSYLDNGNTVTQSITMLYINPTYNFTGAGALTTIGIDYNPVETAINGPNYGLLIRKGLSGFGLGNTMPSAFVDIAASETGKGALRLRAGTAPTGGALVDGLFIYDGTNLYFRQGGTTRTIQWV